MKSNKISIIMPAYQAEKYIGEAIDSVLRQDYENWELIIVDDGSTDQTSVIISRFDDPRIKSIQQKNHGVSKARNAGMSLMTGDFFCFLDADDLLTPNSLSSRLSIFQNTKENIAFVTGGQRQMDADLSTELLIQLPDFYGNPRSALKRLNSKCFINCGTWLIKRDVNENYQFPDHWSHAEDLAFFYSISRQGILKSTEVVSQIYRRINTSAMSNLDGLVSGYSKFILLVKEQHDTSRFDLIYLKTKVLKIVFLSLYKTSSFVQTVSFLRNILLL